MQIRLTNALVTIIFRVTPIAKTPNAPNPVVTRNNAHQEIQRLSIKLCEHRFPIAHHHKLADSRSYRTKSLSHFRSHEHLFNAREPADNLRSPVVPSLTHRYTHAVPTKSAGMFLVFVLCGCSPGIIGDSSKLVLLPGAHFTVIADRP
jgi:hypothetical protein